MILPPLFPFILGRYPQFDAVIKEKDAIEQYILILTVAISYVRFIENYHLNSEVSQRPFPNALPNQIEYVGSQ